MGLPNLITVFRILLIPFFFTSLLSYDRGHESYRWIAFAIFLIASLSDALDGALARLTKSQTDLGKFLDPFADKLLLLSGYLGILLVEALPYRPPLWITVTIVFRDLVVVGGMLILFLLSGTVYIKPNLLGKSTTAFQMITLIAILLEWKLAIPLWYITAILTISSCLTYVFRDLKKLSNFP